MHVQFIPRLGPHHLRYFRIYYQALLIDSHHSPVYIIAIYLYRTIHVMPFPPRHLRQPQINHQYNIIPQQITPCIPSLFHIARHPYIVITRWIYLYSSHMAMIMIYFIMSTTYTPKTIIILCIHCRTCIPLHQQACQASWHRKYYYVIRRPYHHI